VIGLGYVGLPLALRFAEVGVRTLGFDVDPDKVHTLSQGRSYIRHIGDETIKLGKSQGLEATTDFSRIKEVDAILICVPTPLSQHREPDLSYVLRTLESVMPHLRHGQLICLESTTYPGTTDEELRPRIESLGFQVGKDIYLVFSPEREDAGNKEYRTQTIPKVVGGCTDACLRRGIELYELIIDRVIPVSSTKAAELTKLLENIHRAVNIGLVNEMKIIADRMGIDIYEVIRAAATKPFGFVPYYPGPGLGGHCIPIDPFYLTWKAKEYGLHTRFIELAGQINSEMPQWVMAKLVDALNEKSKSVKDSRILVLGISYKKNVDDMRESPAVELMEILRKKGGQVSYSDPWVPVFPKMREHHFNLCSVELTPDSISTFDVILIATDHDFFDYQMILNNANLIVDTRGVYQERAKNVIRA